MLYDLPQQIINQSLNSTQNTNTNTWYSYQIKR